MFSVAKLSIREAVKLYNVSRPTLTKALKTGKLSGVQDGKGRWEIDPSELSRAYQPREVLTGQKSDEFTGFTESDRIELERLKAALTSAEARADAAEKLAQERAERIEDLRRMLPPPAQAKTGWRWPWQK